MQRAKESLDVVLGVVPLDGDPQARPAVEAIDGDVDSVVEAESVEDLDIIDVAW